MGAPLLGSGPIVVAAAMLVGCGGGSGEGLDSNGRPIVPGSGGDAAG